MLRISSTASFNEFPEAVAELEERFPHDFCMGIIGARAGGYVDFHAFIEWGRGGPAKVLLFLSLLVYVEYLFCKPKKQFSLRREPPPLPAATQGLPYAAARSTMREAGLCPAGAPP